MFISGVFFYHLDEKVQTLDSCMPKEITTRFHVVSRLGRGAGGQVFLIKDKVLFHILIFVTYFCYCKNDLYSQL
jgi:hypothetical protein